MPTELVKGDIFEEAEEPGTALAFPTDCDGTMDSGVAVAFKKRWPALAEALAARAPLPLGGVFAWEGEGERGRVRVYALGIQHGGKKPKVSTVDRALRAALERAANDGVTRLSLPRIGGGKTGLDWTRVKRVFQALGEASTVSLVVFEQFVRTKPSADRGVSE